MLWLPTNPKLLGIDPAAPASWRARVIPRAAGVLPVILLYQRWSSFKALVLFIVATALAPVRLCGIGLSTRPADAAPPCHVTAALLVSVSGVIAIWCPMRPRSTRCTCVAAGSRGGRRLQVRRHPNVLAWLGFFDHFLLSAPLLAIPWCQPSSPVAGGVETRGIGLRRHSGRDDANLGGAHQPVGAPRRQRRSADLAFQVARVDQQRFPVRAVRQHGLEQVGGTTFAPLFMECLVSLISGCLPPSSIHHAGHHAGQFTRCPCRRWRSAHLQDGLTDGIRIPDR